MEIRVLRYFLKVAQEESITHAAELLHITQPTLSRQLAQLEEELGAPLFDRTSRRVRLTLLGERMLPFARQICDAQLSIQAVIQNQLDAQRGKVTIDSIPAVAQYGITDVVARFRSRYPGYAISVSENQPRLSEHNLRHGLCELAFIRRRADEPAPPDLSEIPFCDDDELVAVLQPDHPLADCASIRLEQLAGETLITLEEGSLPHDLLLSACRSAGFVPLIGFTCHRVDSILDLAGKGIGVGLLMRGHTVLPQPSENPSFVVRSILPQIATRVSLYCRKGEPLSAAAQAFLDCLDP